MLLIKVDGKVLKCGGKVVTDDLVLLVKLAGDGKTLTVTPTKDISATLTRYMLVLTPASGSATEVNIGNTGTYDLSLLHGTVQDGKYTLSVYAVLSSGNTAPFGSIEHYVLAPCNAMTLRFKFSKSGYDPVNAGVGSAGTWNHLIDDVWDWTNTNADWHDAFKGAFTADDNEVEVIGAGDTSNVTNTAGMFSGIYSNGLSSTSFSITQRNNIVDCANFNINNATDITNMFVASNLRCANFDLSQYSSSVGGFYGATKITSIKTIDVSSATSVFTLFARSDIKTIDGILVSRSATVAAAVFYGCPNLEYFGGFLGDSGTIRTYKVIFGGAGCRNLTTVARPINIAGVDYSDGLQQIIGGLWSLKQVSFINSPAAGVTSAMAMMNGCKSLSEIPYIDTKSIESFYNAFSVMETIDTIPDFIDISSATDVREMFRGCINVKYGILEMYNKLLARGSAITKHTDCFKNCGRDTPEGQAALAQIPSDWGGTKST